MAESHAPVVEMLWEAHDPHRALDARFGFSEGESAGRMLAKWSVVRERFPRLLEMARLTRWLDGHGLPVSAPVPAQDGCPQVEVDGVSMCRIPVIRHDGAVTGQPTAEQTRFQDSLAGLFDLLKRASMWVAPAARLAR